MRYVLLIVVGVMAAACGGGQSEFDTNLGGGTGSGNNPAGSIYDAAQADSGSTGSGGSTGGGAVNPGVSPGGNPADPPVVDPPVEPGEDGIEIESFVKLPGEQNDTFWSWDWEVTVHNANTFAVDVLVKVNYFDADFTVLHLDEETIHVPANGSEVAAGTSELDPDDAANVAAVEASIELAT